MGWFRSGRSEEDGWKFDVVGLLTVLGESSIKRHVRTISASSISILPRLLPAPQSILKAERPSRLPSVKDVTVVGVYSGNHLKELNFFADVIHDINSLEPKEFRVYEISYAENDNASKAERGRRRRRAWATWGWLRDKKWLRWFGGNSCEEDDKSIDVPIKPFCWLNFVSLFSMIVTIGLWVGAFVVHDGIAVISIATMSISTSLACIAGSWYPVLEKRPTDAEVPPGDMVIVTRPGAFVVVHCSEEIARELYGGTETCQYMLRDLPHQIVLGGSTMLFMASVLLFSNCSWTMQTALSVAYLVLNILYWAVPLYFRKKDDIWDMSRYHVEYQSIIPKDKDDKKSYTQTLWSAIHTTKETDWVRNGKLAPSGEAWEQWLKEAQDNCANGNWDAVGAKDRLMNPAGARLPASPKSNGRICTV